MEDKDFNRHRNRDRRKAVRLYTNGNIKDSRLKTIPPWELKRLQQFASRFFDVYADHNPLKSA